MNILYYSPNPEQDMADDTGYGRHQREMISALRKIGHVVDVVNITSESNVLGGKQENRAKTNPIKRWVPPILWSTLRDFKRVLIDKYRSSPILLKILASKKYDAIYERSNYLLTSGVNAAKQYKIPLVLEVNAPCVLERKEFEGNSWLTWFARMRESQKYRYASKIFPVTSVLGSYISKKYSIPESKIRFISNAINDDDIALDLNNIPTDVVEWCSDSLVVGFIGSLLAYHGVDKLIDAFLRLADDHPNIKLLIVGDGEVLPTLKEMATQSAFSGRIKFTGQVSKKEVYSYISLMDIGVSPAHSWYGSPIKIFEYAALGAVVLAPKEPNIEDVFVHMESAYLFDGPEQLIPSLAELIDEVELRSKLSESGQKLILNKHTWKSNARILENELLNLV
ncbi:MAG: glycosyltransferase family 4 protein [Flavobacteriales bacterium]|nr:glycosyltransferase family 4 protein [Flavobacteriales bacterium]